MKASLTINGVEYPIYNNLTFSERIDEELDSGDVQIISNDSTPFPEYSIAKLTLECGDEKKIFDFFAFDTVEKRRGYTANEHSIDKFKDGYYIHTLSLVELTRLLMGVMIDGKAIVQPIDGSDKKTLYEVVKTLLKTAKLLKVENGITQGSKFYLRPDYSVDKKELAQISPEFRWECGTLLWECLQDIANVIDCIPRVVIGEGGSLYVTFDKINEVTGVYEI